MAFEQQILECMETLIQGDGITDIRRSKRLISAWVNDLVEGQDYTVPLYISFLPYEGEMRGEWQLQILLTLSKNISPEHFELLTKKLEELNNLVDIGSLLLLPEGEIAYAARLLLTEDDPEAAICSISEALQLMLLFLMDYYVYILALSANPGQLTLTRYQEQWGGIVDDAWRLVAIPESLQTQLKKYLLEECERVESAEHGIAFMTSHIAGEDAWKAAGVLRFLENQLSEEERIQRMQLELLVLDDIPEEYLSECRGRMQELSRQTTFGYLTLNEKHQILYRYSCPVSVNQPEQTRQIFEAVIYEMVLFLDCFYPYLLTSALSPERMTLSDYIARVAELAGTQQDKQISDEE